MRIAYLVFAYKNPHVLERAITRLSCNDSTFFIHIDHKSDIAAFSNIRGQNIVFTDKRIPVYWAEFSGVEAILLLMRHALRTSAYDYLILLSGSEYPLRSAAYIHAFLEHHQGLEFINMAKMPAPGKPLSQITTLRYQSDEPVRRFAVRALAKLGLAKRDYKKYLGSMEPYAGITWWALTTEACQYVLEFVERNQPVVQFFRDVFVPEETFVHTVLGNSAFRSRVSRNLLYEDWTGAGGHPAMITAEHVAFFESQDTVCGDDGYGPGELLFARKFSDADEELLRRIDLMIDRKEGGGFPASPNTQASVFRDTIGEANTAGLDGNAYTP